MSSQQAISQVFRMHVRTACIGMPQLHGITYSQYHTLHYNYKCTALSSHVVLDSPAQATMAINYNMIQ